ncbi:c-type cytochrome [Azospirillum picis]|uniref:Nicotinate dehydrogenase subunit B n=1 Tax=Azospirillum picis TaxID=488438 RepID=A0ABU0MNC3_9PROT|nr:cytochrome c [Azospirillum picis]MBP2301854.1 nicotinate dehydrogenase subunit B [Azospirillum picis]MDQ0534971.1 nicotinate dehydrogenase subunit B [Azospirillum picis]
MKPIKWAFGGALACLLGVGAFAGISYRSALPPIPPPAADGFPAELVAKGATLAAIGDCVVCHTADQGAAYAGGRALPTPFGTLYASNITPDAATGIGSWSLDAFKRAMRDGVGRDGSHLYPALPYDHYRRVHDGDLEAIYAFLMTRQPVSAPAKPNDMIFPLGFRPLLAGWKLMFLHQPEFQPVPGRDAQWNRGAYLVEGLGHCGGCHSPRNLAGAEEDGSSAYSGGVAEGWTAPALTAASRAPVPWTADSLYAYLRAGLDGRHGVAAGPMGPVVHGLSRAPEADVRAIAVYIASLSAPPGGAGQPADRPPAIDRADRAAQADPAGAALFAGACAGCHEAGAPMLTQGRPPLATATALQLDEPANALRAILNGIHPPAGAAGPAMPPFTASLTDAQAARIAAYLRTRFSDRPAWTDLEQAAAEIREEDTRQ